MLPLALVLAGLPLALPHVDVMAQSATGTPTIEITPAPDAPRLELTFTELNDSGISGTAMLFAAGDRTIVELRLRDTGENHPAHIHAGTCGDLRAEPEVPLENVSADGLSTTVVERPLQTLIDGEFAIDVHLSPNELGTLVACVEIDGQPTTPVTGGTPAPATAAVATPTAPATPTNVAVATEPPAPTEPPTPLRATALARATIRAATTAIVTVTAGGAAEPTQAVPTAPPTAAPTQAPPILTPTPTQPAAPTATATVSPTQAPQAPQRGTVIGDSTPVVDDGTGGAIPPAAVSTEIPPVDIAGPTATPPGADPAPTAIPPAGASEPTATPPVADPAPTTIPPVAGAVVTSVPPVADAPTVAPPTEVIPPLGDGTQGGVDDSGKGAAIAPVAPVGIGGGSAQGDVTGSGTSAPADQTSLSGDGTQGDIADAGKGVPLDPTTGLPATAGTGSSLDWPAGSRGPLPWIMAAMSIALLVAGAAIRATSAPRARASDYLR